MRGYHWGTVSIASLCLVLNPDKLFIEETYWKILADDLRTLIAHVLLWAQVRHETKLMTCIAQVFQYNLTITTTQNSLD